MHLGGESALFDVAFDRLERFYHIKVDSMEKNVLYQRIGSDFDTADYKNSIAKKVEYFAVHHHLLMIRFFKEIN